MNRFLIKIAGAAIAAFALISHANAFEAPKLQSHVNDYAHVLSESDRRALDNKLNDYERSTQGNPQIVILTVPNLPGDEDIDSYKNKTFEAWKLGHKDNSNGILTVVSMDHKIGIETGYDLESAVPTSTAQEIITRMKPNLKTGNFKQAFNDELDMMLPLVAKYQTENDVKNHSKTDNSQSHLGAIMLTIIFLLAIGYFVYRAFFRTKKPNSDYKTYTDYPTPRNPTYSRDPYQTNYSRPVPPAYPSQPYSNPTYNEPEKKSSVIGSVLAGAAAGALAEEVLSSNRRNNDTSSNWSSSDSNYSSSSDSSSSSSSDSGYSGDSGSSGGGGSSDSW